MIAVGSQSQIWEVSPQGSSDRFAMKLLLNDQFKESEVLASFKAESKILSSFNHPNVIKFIKYVKTKQHAYFIMELFRAPSLRVYAQNDLLGMQVRFKRLVELTCMGLGYMHEKGWVHKDVKPENILLSKGSEIRLIDFALSTKFATGVAKLFSGRPKEIQGTRSYLAPETIKRLAATPQTDIYSLGIVLYEILVGTTPFKGMSPTELLKKHLTEKPVPPSELNTNVTKETDRCIMRMLAKKPADRHKSMQEVVSEFRNIKVFKEDVEELAARLRNSASDELFSGLQRKLDSRADAKRMEQIKADPELAKKFKSTSAGSLKTAKTNFSKAEAPQPAAVEQGMPPQGYPQQMPPGYGYPGAMPMPQYPGQYYPQPQGMPPGYPYPPPGYPQMYPGQAYPGMPYPQAPGAPGIPGAQPQGAPMPPGTPPPGAQPPAANQPGTAAMPAPLAAAPAAPATAAAPVKKPRSAGHVRIDSTSETNLDDIPVMDELPDID